MHRLVGTFALATAVLLATPAFALAASPPQTPAQISAAPNSGSLTVPIVGTNGTDAVATITSFRVVDGVLTAVGTITGDVTTMVGGVPLTTTVTNAPFTAPVALTGACPVLDLDIGAIHLDLLGLIVDLSPIHLDITAQPGAGNLLGNLLCAVTHLLDNGASHNGIAALLNNILGAL
jgi:hypothetical protein